jgi:hypothetical protein
MDNTEPVMHGEVIETEDSKEDPSHHEVVPQEKTTLSPLASHLVHALEEVQHHTDEQKLTVNELVSKVAVWYEKLRKAMEYREEEVLLRATIERILKRRLLLGGNAQTTAEPLVRELLWARYLPEHDVAESLVNRVEESIDLFLQLRFAVLQNHALSESIVNTWIYQLMSSDIEHIVSPNREKETVGNFMYQVLKPYVVIEGEDEQTQNAQVYIAVRKAFARDDIAFLRYNLFRLYFGSLTRESLSDISHRFLEGYKEIVQELNYPKKEKIYAYVKKRTAPFLILEDVLRANKGHVKRVVHNPDELNISILAACETRYKSVGVKVRTAIIRSVVFILMTKVIFAFAVEGTYERIVYGGIQWSTILINTTIPPLLMIIVSFFIRTPGKENSDRIVSFIHQLLFAETPKIGNPLHLKKKQAKPRPITFVFTLLWFLAFVVTFGGIMAILSRLGFNIVSQFIFLFFLTIVSFLSYRISLTAHIYQLGDKQGWFTPIADFLFMPIIRVGRGLTQSISQVNFFLFLFDFLIEAPFKTLFGFFEQWFSFLHSKREEME